ncbi:MULTISPECIES: hypothetical protein [Streptomyces]|uniref:hypothetical protein n=1 Tax=Streptomyces TaxID=1883 RepID=UPI00278C0B27|nr:hypothetical protein [Streptomyces hydrogenans]
MPRWVIGLWVAMGALFVLAPLGVLVGYVSVSGENHEGMRFPSDDVRVARCAVDPVSGRPVAELWVTSRAERAGTYTVTVEFLDGGGKAVGRGVGRVEDLAVGATRRTVVVGEEEYGRGGPECVVRDAEFGSSGPAGEGAP